MSAYEFWSIVILAITAVILAGTAVIFVVQTRIALTVFQADHDRRRREATIHYMNQIRVRYRETNHEIIRRLGPGILDDNKISEIVQDEQLLDRVKDMLGLFEHLAVGANTDVFEVEMLSRMSGGYLKAVYRRFERYIEQRRFETNSPTLYIEYERFVNDLASLTNRAGAR